MKFNFIYTISFVFATSGAFAQEECKVINDDKERLICFDRAFGVGMVQDQMDGEIGKWDVTTETSAFTDDKTVFMQLESTDTIRGRFGGPGPALFLVRCQENTTSAFFVLNDMHLADIQSYGRIEYRVDDKKMTARSFTQSTDNKALGLWNGGRSIPFLKEILGGKQLIIRATPYAESPVTATFDIRGMDVAVSELRETCNW